MTGDDEFPQPQAVPSEFLTPELRAKFDRKGEALVLQEIHRYSTFEKRQAAVDWCQERREERERRETRRYHVMVVLTAAAAVSAFFSAAVAKNWL